MKMEKTYRNIQIVKYCLKRSIRKPRLIWKLIKLQLGLFVGKIPPFREIEIATTYECNLKCTHCSAETLKEVGKKCLTLADYSKLGKECKKYNVPLVTFTGGEPLLDKRLERIISYFNPKGTIIGVTTNGTLLDENKIKQLKKIGVDTVAVSLDSTNPQIHDTFRNTRGAFKKSLKSIKSLKKHGFDVMIIMTIHHKNIHGDFVNMIEFAKKLGVTLHVSLAAPAGNWANEESFKKYALTESDRSFLADLRKKYRFIRRDIDGNYDKKGCPAGTERLCLTPTGEVLPCTKIHVTFGNIKKDSLMTIRKRVLRHKEFSEIPCWCIAAEDTSFIKKYMKNCFGKNKTLLQEPDFFNMHHEEKK
jgi:MoaA/NifB/PqqE/SkfB family radical SAM enzyme